MPAQATASRSFYQQQIDRLSYLADDYPKVRVYPEPTQPPAFEEVLTEQNSQMSQRESRAVLLLPTKVSRTDPYEILAAAGHTGRLSKVHRSSRRSGILPTIMQLPTQIAQLKTQIVATANRQSERFAMILTSKKDQLQRLSSEQVERRRHDLDGFLEYAIKAPLRNAFQTIEVLSHRAAKQLR